MSPTLVQNSAMMPESPCSETMRTRMPHTACRFRRFLREWVIETKPPCRDGHDKGGAKRIASWEADSSLATLLRQAAVFSTHTVNTVHFQGFIGGAPCGLKFFM